MDKQTKKEVAKVVIRTICEVGVVLCGGDTKKTYKKITDEKKPDETISRGKKMELVEAICDNHLLDYDTEAIFRYIDSEEKADEVLKLLKCFDRYTLFKLIH